MELAHQCPPPIELLVISHTAVLSHVLVWTCMFWSCSATAQMASWLNVLMGRGARVKNGHLHYTELRDIAEVRVCRYCTLGFELMFQDFAVEYENKYKWQHFDTLLETIKCKRGQKELNDFFLFPAKDCAKPSPPPHPATTGPGNFNSMSGTCMKSVSWVSPFFSSPTMSCGNSILCPLWCLNTDVRGICFKNLLKGKSSQKRSSNNMFYADTLV